MFGAGSGDSDALKQREHERKTDPNNAAPANNSRGRLLKMKSEGMTATTTNPLAWRINDNESSNDVEPGI